MNQFIQCAVVAVLLLFATFKGFSQQHEAFTQTYNAFPELPRGILEAVAYCNTHMRELSENDSISCLGMPQAYGIMGVFANGQGYFRENGKLIAKLSGISVVEQKQSIEKQIFAYAHCFHLLMARENLIDSSASEERIISNVLRQMSEIPEEGLVNDFALDAQIFQYLSFMYSTEKAREFNFPVYHFDLEEVFGVDNYNVLSARRIQLDTSGIHSGNTHYHSQNTTKSNEFGPAIWNPAATCNYSSRNGTAIAAVTIHTIQGTYAGAISWAQNCNAGVSYHYVIRSSDGQVTQMVHEGDKAWHVGSENTYSIGIEHEGFVSDSSWYTAALYQQSALLCKDIVNSGYGIPACRTYYGAASNALNTLGACTKIKGHQHFPNQTHTDPGVHWNWEKFYRLINDEASIQTFSNLTGLLHDSGGLANDYSDDERMFWLIEPAGADSIQLEFTSFFLESDYDFLFIYDGATIDAQLIGKFSGADSPGTIVSSGNALLLEFRSDCGVQNAGWEAHFTAFSSQISNLNEDENDFLLVPNPTVDYLTIKGITESTQLSIYASDGKIIGKWISDHDLTIDLSSCSAGYYFVAGTTVNSSTIMRLLIIK